jgi:hypothetical protein
MVLKEDSKSHRVIWGPVFAHRQPLYLRICLDQLSCHIGPSCLVALGRLFKLLSASLHLAQRGLQHGSSSSNHQHPPKRWKAALYLSSALAFCFISAIAEAAVKLLLPACCRGLGSQKECCQGCRTATDLHVFQALRLLSSQFLLPCQAVFQA